MSKVSKKRKTLIAALAACAITVIGLVGCGSATNEAKSAEEVYEHYSQTAHDNYKMDGTLTMNVTVQGMSMEVPMEMHLESADKALHSTLSTKLFGTDSVTESYVIPEGDNYVIYTGAQSLTSDNTDELEWSKVTSTEMNESIGAIANLEKNMFEGAEFAKTTDGYTITIPFSKMIQAMNEASNGNGDEFTTMMEEMSAAGVDLGEIKTTYNFDRDYNLTKILIEKTQIPYEVQGQKGSIEIACDFTLSEFGKIAPIKVPDEVVKVATEYDSSFNDAMTFFDEDETTSDSKASEAETTNATETSASAQSAKESASAAASAGSAAVEGASNAANAASDNADAANKK